MKCYPSDLAPDTFAVAEDPVLPEITAGEQAAVRAAQERVNRYYRENPDAEEIDKRMNEELHAIARRTRVSGS